MALQSCSGTASVATSRSVSPIDVPDLVSAVVVYEMPMSWLDSWPNNSAGAAAMAAPDASEAAEAFIRRLVGDEAWDRLSPAKQELRRAEGQAMVAELADLRASAPWSPARITVPVLAMFGENGRPHHQTAMQAFPDLIANGAVWRVPEAGHAGPHSHAEAVGSRGDDVHRRAARRRLVSSVTTAVTAAVADSHAVPPIPYRP